MIYVQCVASIRFNVETKELLYVTIIEMLDSKRSYLQIPGIHMACEVCNYDDINDQLLVRVLEAMNRSESTAVRRATLLAFKKYTHYTIVFLSRRFRDRSPDLRTLAFKIAIEKGLKLNDF